MDYTAEVNIDIPDDEIKDYVKDNFEPDDVFSKEQLIECVNDLCIPEDVFSPKEMREWADRNGFIEA